MELIMTNKKPTKSRPKPEQTSGSSHCIDAITALANGDLSHWQGLSDRCTRADIEYVLSLITSEVNESNPYSGPLDYAPTPGAPSGLTVHYDVETVDYITIVGPLFRQPIQEILGAPEGKIQSSLQGSREQWVYPSLGLAFHMKEWESGVNRAYVFQPTTLELYKMSPISRVRTLRHKKR
jgi:hypothetical protein